MEKDKAARQKHNAEQRGEMLGPPCRHTFSVSSVAALPCANLLFKACILFMANIVSHDYLHNWPLMHGSAQAC